jgi:hypothetical protein
MTFSEQTRGEVENGVDLLLVRRRRLENQNQVPEFQASLRGQDNAIWARPSRGRRNSTLSEVLVVNTMGLEQGGKEPQGMAGTLYPPDSHRQVPGGSQESNTVINLPVPYLIPLEGFSAVTKTMPRNNTVEPLLWVRGQLSMACHGFD